MAVRRKGVSQPDVLPQIPLKADPALADRPAALVHSQYP